MIRSFAMALLASSALIACAVQAKPRSVATEPVLQAATVQADPPAPAKTVDMTLPVPSPFVLPPPSSRPSKVKNRPSVDRVDVANRKAIREPSSYGYVNAVQVYPWSEGALYRLYAAPERVSDISLQAGEALISVASGDTVRWVIGDTTSGAGSSRRTHILVKPIAPGLKTNLVITTDRRTYHLQLESTAATAMAAISWEYPVDALLAIQRATAVAESQIPIASGLAIEHLNFGYSISGDDPPWRPLRAFDDGAQVFIEFSADIVQGEAPPLFVIGEGGTGQLVNYRVRGRYYIVDRLFVTAELRLGAKHQQIVRITKGNAKAAKRSRRSQP